VTTWLKNLEMSGNLTAVSEMLAATNFRLTVSSFPRQGVYLEIFLTAGKCRGKTFSGKNCILSTSSLGYTSVLWTCIACFKDLLLIKSVPPLCTDVYSVLQCVDAVGWAAGRASGL